MSTIIIMIAGSSHTVYEFQTRVNIVNICQGRWDTNTQSATVSVARDYSGNMRRWFVALVPPSDIQGKASAIIDELTVKYGTRTARAMPHVTLIAPFEVIADEGEAILPVKQVLRQVTQASKPFTVSLAGFNSFAPRVLFIDVNKSACLSELKQHLERALAEVCVITPDNRHYQPHMTIASRKVHKNNFMRIWQDLDNGTIEEAWQCTEVSLLVYEDKRWKVDMTFPID